MVQCAKGERQCLNSCSGVDNSNLNYDFHTIVGITELGVISLGAAGHAAAEANCSIKSTILEVPAFGGGAQSATSNSHTLLTQRPLLNQVPRSRPSRRDCAFGPA